MATAYVAVGYLIDESGERREFADKVEIANTTDAEKANFQRLLDYGIVSTEKPVKDSGRGQ